MARKAFSGEMANKLKDEKEADLQMGRGRTFRRGTANSTLGRTKLSGGVSRKSARAEEVGIR